ncbi:MAG: polysaccharide deacetylase family protein [Candidatus Aceula meridiana]|nr:polysaccharide deacetylase family protein [Candidatus Aceula meridiana]
MKAIVKKILGIIGRNYFFNFIKFINKGKLVIIYYHRVVETEDLAIVGYDNMCTEKNSFEDQMRFLKEEYNPVKEEDIVAFLKGEKILPKHPVWVTFDDGYKDNYEVAYPILKKYGVPATFFVTTGFIDKKIVPPEGIAVNNDVENLFMSWDEIKEMADSGFGIGAHTVNHKVLSSLGEEAAEKEIAESKYEIEKKINKEVISFAYPKGKSSECNLSMCFPILKKYCFQLAVTTIGGNNKINFNKNRFGLRRIGVSLDDTFSFFKLKVSMGSFWQR